MKHLANFLAMSGLALAAELQQIADFGPNPSNVTFYLYLPDSFSPDSSFPLLVYPHWCHGTALDAFSSKPWRGVADDLGFAVIYPSSPWTTDNCWDVSSRATLTHDAGGDSLGIASMVRWTLEQHGPDPDRVFVAGTSSGAMMANVLAATYPELFAAASAGAGVPYSCFSAAAGGGDEDGQDVWSDDCAKGKITHSGEEWAALVHAAEQGYTGVRPKMQLMHGTADEVLNVTNWHEEIKMWTAVLGVGKDEPTQTTQDTPEEGWTKYVYGEDGLVEGFLADGVTHDIPDQVDEIVRFFDLDCQGDDCFSRKTLADLEGVRAKCR